MLEGTTYNSLGRKLIRDNPNSLFAAGFNMCMAKHRLYKNMLPKYNKIMLKINRLIYSLQIV